MTDAVMEARRTGAENVVWDLSVFYGGVDDPQIQTDMEALTRRADEFAAQYKGRVAKLDSEELIDLLQELEAINTGGGRISAFASLLHSTDTNDPKAGALLQKVTEFGAQLQQKIVFFNLEWNQVDEAQVTNLLARPELAQYRHALEAWRRYQPYQLSEPEEQLVMEKDVTGRSAWTRFFTQMMGALRFDYDGERLTQAQILNKLYEADRETRRKAADVVTETLRDRSMELTYIFNVLAADKASTDRIRSYETWVKSRNLSNKAPDSVVDALVTAVTSNYDIVAQHYDLKRALLGVDTLNDYDRYAPIPTKDSDTFYTWDEAREIVVNAFSAFSPRMGEIAAEFFDNHWIHAAPSPNKRSGAYAHPTVPKAHPFVFMSYLGKPRDVMTLAHELGHGLHMYLTNEQQNIFHAYTPLTTAEMASVFGEMLVFQDLMRKETDPEVRLSMLVQKIEDTFATVFRQIAMNRFEDAMHTARRSEGELNTERLSEIWLETQRAMFGDSVNLRDEYGVWWSYIPHFLHTPGYVYAYSFGELLVMALYQVYQERGETFVPQYLNVLGAGDSNYPDQIMAQVGIDLNDPKFWNKGLDAIRALVEEEVQLAHQVFPDKF